MSSRAIAPSQPTQSRARVPRAPPTPAVDPSSHYPRADFGGPEIHEQFYNLSIRHGPNFFSEEEVIRCNAAAGINVQGRTHRGSPPSGTSVAPTIYQKEENDRSLYMDSSPLEPFMQSSPTPQLTHFHDAMGHPDASFFNKQMSSNIVPRARGTQIVHSTYHTASGSKPSTSYPQPGPHMTLPRVRNTAPAPEDRKHKCTVPGCPDAFTRADLLKRHLNSSIHRNVQGYSCRYCGKKDTRSDNSQQHERNCRMNPNRGSA